MRKEPFQMDKIFKRLTMPNIKEDVGKQKFKPCRQSTGQCAHLATPSKAGGVRALSHSHSISGYRAWTVQLAAQLKPNLRPRAQHIFKAPQVVV